ncbi:unnamed protein product, partial [Choristocarpus tenellus]
MPLRPRWFCRLLQALQGMMSDTPGPQRFFLLDGVTSGLLLPRMPRWPAPRGYSFLAWVRVEAPSRSVVTGLGPGETRLGSESVVSGGSRGRLGGGGHCPCIFDFQGEKGHGVAACLVRIPESSSRARERKEAAGVPSVGKADPSRSHRYALELRVGGGHRNPVKAVRFPELVVREGCWTFLGVTQSAAGWGHHSVAAALVDDRWCRVNTPFPPLRDGGLTGSIACRVPLNSSGTGEEERSSNYLAGVEGGKGGGGGGVKGSEESAGSGSALCSLRGQMGAVYLFEGALTEEQLRGVRQLGPDYAFSFQTPTVDSRDLPLVQGRDPRLHALSEAAAAPRQAPRATPPQLSGPQQQALNSTGQGEGEPVGALTFTSDGGGDGVGTTVAAVSASGGKRPDWHKAALSGVLTSRILLAYNPCVWEGELFLDNTPSQNPVRWTNQ